MELQAEAMEERFLAGLYGLLSLFSFTTQVHLPRDGMPPLGQDLEHQP